LLLEDFFDPRETLSLSFLLERLPLLALALPPRDSSSLILSNSPSSSGLLLFGCRAFLASSASSCCVFFGAFFHKPQQSQSHHSSAFLSGVMRALRSLLASSLASHYSLVGVHQQQQMIDNMVTMTGQTVTIVMDLAKPSSLQTR